MIEKHQASMRKTAVIAHNISSKLPTVVLHRMYTLVPMSGETKRFAVTFDWNRPKIVKDWSVTAWGTDHEVTVAHEDGISSKSLPYYG